MDAPKTVDTAYGTVDAAVLRNLKGSLYVDFESRRYHRGEAPVAALEHPAPAWHGASSDRWCSPHSRSKGTNLATCG